jgi:hypothetical protein
MPADGERAATAREITRDEASALVAQRFAERFTVARDGTAAIVVWWSTVDRAIVWWARSFIRLNGVLEVDAEDGNTIESPSV